MELLSPAGNLEKLKYAYLFGADAAYIGIQNFSLRTRADNFSLDEKDYIEKIKGNRKLYCALNIYFHNADLRRLEESIDQFAAYPFDAFIISDPGIIPLLRRTFPSTELHLSTQANCLNSESAKFYRDAGFSRLILGREASLREISEIKNAVPEVEIEAFVHGAMCLAYSGRCFLSSWMTGRSANSGDCAHSCRWEYKLLEEKKRPGEYYPVLEGEDFTTILSSKDMCMIDRLADLKDAGVDSLKIEGRMKSIYYTAVVTRAYRKALDALSGSADPRLDDYIEELYKVSHREFSRGFFYGKDDINVPTEKTYERRYTFLGSLGPEVEPGCRQLDVKNQIKVSDTIEYIGPDLLFLEDTGFTLLDADNQPVSQADHGKVYTLKTDLPVEEGYLLRRANPSNKDAEIGR